MFQKDRFLQKLRDLKTPEYIVLKVERIITMLEGYIPRSNFDESSSYRITVYLDGDSTLLKLMDLGIVLKGKKYPKMTHNWEDFVRYDYFREIIDFAKVMDEIQPKGKRVQMAENWKDQKERGQEIDKKKLSNDNVTFDKDLIDDEKFERYLTGLKGLVVSISG